MKRYLFPILFLFASALPAQSLYCPPGPWNVSQPYTCELHDFGPWDLVPIKVTNRIFGGPEWVEEFYVLTDGNGHAMFDAMGLPWYVTVVVEVVGTPMVEERRIKH